MCKVLINSSVSVDDIINLCRQVVNRSTTVVYHVIGYTSSGRHQVIRL